MTKKRQNSLKAGFTLIELLVVLSIIALFTSVVIASIKNAYARSDDFTIKTELRKVQLSLQIYYDNHGGFPACTTAAPCCIAGFTCTWNVNNQNFVYNEELIPIKTTVGVAHVESNLAGVGTPLYTSNVYLKKAFVYYCNNVVVINSLRLCGETDATLGFQTQGGSVQNIIQAKDIDWANTLASTTSTTNVCTDTSATNYSATGACTYYHQNGNTQCLDPKAINYGSYASCSIGGCMNSAYTQYDATATYDNGSCMTCIVAGCGGGEI